MKTRFTEKQTIPSGFSESKEEFSSLSRYFKDIGKHALLTQDEELSISRKALKGDLEALERLVKSNLRLVVLIAKEYRNMGLPFLDLISEGNLGLFKAAKRYDPARGTRFSTYSSYWIRQYIRRALANQSRTIRVPAYLVDRMACMRRVEVRLIHQLGRTPTNAELAKEMELKITQIKWMRAKQKFVVSLDDCYEESVQDLHEYLADLNSEETTDYVARMEEQTLVSEAMESLSKREKDIIINRFGLEGKPVRTLERIASGYGLTKERMRQIQVVALKKLRVKMKSDSALLNAV